MKDYKEIIKDKRNQLGISQNKLSKTVGISQPFMNEIESGRKSPSLEIFFKICECLDIRIFNED